MIPKQATAPPGAPIATVTIEIVRSVPVQKNLTPSTPLEISFTHPAGKPTHQRPHEIRWVAKGLAGEEWIEIQLDTSFPGFATKPAHVHTRPWWEYLQKLFPTALVLPSGAFGWQLTPAMPSLDSGQAAWDERFELKPRAGSGRPLLAYAIVFFDELGVEHVLDPDVDVTPDP